MPTTSNPPEKMMFQLNLRRRGISDQAVLRAMEEIPRDAFVETADRNDAWRDSALGIACGQTISQPFVVAYMTEQLQLRERASRARDRHRLGLPGRDPVAAVPAGADHRALPDPGRQRSYRLKKLGCDNVEVMLGDGFDIPAASGQFDRIIVTAAMEQVSEKLTRRLEPGGILIAPVGPHQGIQTLIRMVRTDAGIERKALVDVRFVPALPGIAREL